MTKAIAYEVNVTTGQIVERERTAEELAAEGAEQAERAAAAAEEAAAEEAAVAQKTAILNSLAQAVGYTVDELRKAFDV